MEIPDPFKIDLGEAIAELYDNLLNMGFPKEGLRVISETPHRRWMAESRPSVPSRVNKGVVLAAGWGEIYGKTLDNIVLEVHVEARKKSFMDDGLGNLVNIGWHVMSLYPETQEKAWQVIEFILSDRNYIYDPIFRFPRGYVWKEGDRIASPSTIGALTAFRRILPPGVNVTVNPDAKGVTFEFD
ncbi:hypothetical protein CC2G_013504 [Coprinopsis cinerea AmutBmut pab1-1]|nr:hypothetical protein CC2G_013504 [Coprinopsis cinerea AmutBmut pab1-1]